jgi:hypothetical protein
MKRIELTPKGRQWAEQMTSELVPRVALQGYDQGWPDAHVITAITICNQGGDTWIERHSHELDDILRGKHGTAEDFVERLDKEANAC